MHEYDILKSKIRSFQSRSYTDNFTYQDLLNKYNNEPICYITGRYIDLKDSQSYHLDHKKPVALGGSSTLYNCEFCIAEVNMAKGAIRHEDFIQLCKDVYYHHNQPNYIKDQYFIDLLGFSTKGFYKFIERFDLSFKEPTKLLLIIGSIFLFQLAIGKQKTWKTFQVLSGISRKVK